MQGFSTRSASAPGPDVAVDIISSQPGLVIAVSHWCLFVEEWRSSGLPAWLLGRCPADACRVLCGVLFSPLAEGALTEKGL